MRSTFLGLIALGGAFGTAIRWLALEAAGAGNDSVTVFALNVVGSAVVGFLAGSGFSGTARISQTIWPLAAIGFCGGLTTFSGFALQVADNLDRGHLTSGAWLTIFTAAFAVSGAIGGYLLGSRSRMAA